MYKGAGSISEIPQETERQAKQLTIVGRHYQPASSRLEYELKCDCLCTCDARKRYSLFYSCTEMRSLLKSAICICLIRDCK